MDIANIFGLISLKLQLWILLEFSKKKNVKNFQESDHSLMVWNYSLYEFWRHFHSEMNVTNTNILNLYPDPHNNWNHKMWDKIIGCKCKWGNNVLCIVYTYIILYIFQWDCILCLKWSVMETHTHRLNKKNDYHCLHAFVCC